MREMDLSFVLGSFVNSCELSDQIYVIDFIDRAEVPAPQPRRDLRRNDFSLGRSADAGD